MSTLSLRLPESLHRRLADLAAREGVSINQLIATAVAEKMSALETEQLLTARAARGSWSLFVAALKKVPDVAPRPGDEVPTAKARSRKPSTERRRRKTG